ncbi:hypothetical protein AVEN_25327-1 [Araneus ventricosus]|uniref:Uncharacterized protein n=1 Tax=Araneus ventricosus TaxID=182803 RepID=A0A4Y2EGP6_ARAVE|nr:hypothetical protein AVEN_25327-1 [Araneus ventricosus]
MSKNHPGKNRCPASVGSSSQHTAPLHYFGSDVPIKLTSMRGKGEDGCEISDADHKTARMAINLQTFCSWAIIQDPTQQGTQKNTFVAWDGRDWITQPTALILPHQTYTFSKQQKPVKQGLSLFTGGVLGSNCLLRVLAFQIRLTLCL